jgi:peptidoglycan hydrolase-like protein with peptidoglycan-binding domain
VYGGSRAASAATSASGPASDPLRAKRFFFGGLAIGVIVMSVVGLATTVFIESPGDVAAQSAAPPATTLTAVARWQVLREAITVPGIVRSTRNITILGRAPYATVTLTRLPVRPGDRVRPGHVIAEIDGRPVILLRGTLPAYRDLHVGDHGPDVGQLQRALQSLGYADFDPRGSFGQSTALALLLFYQHLGYEAPLFHPARRRARAQVSRAGQPVAGSLTATELVIPSAYLPRSEVVFIPAKSALVAAVAARVGDLVRNSAVLTLAVGNPYVRAVLSRHQAAQAHRGMPVRIVTASPGLTVTGTVTRVGLLSAGGSQPAGRYPVLIRPRRALPQRMIGASVRLTLRTPVTSAPVLTVPVAAILAARHGHAAYVVKITAGRRVRVAIVTGPSANGLVAVQSVRRGKLRPGDHVLIGVGPWPSSR